MEHFLITLQECYLHPCLYIQTHLQLQYHLHHQLLWIVKVKHQWCKIIFVLKLMIINMILIKRSTQANLQFSHPDLCQLCVAPHVFWWCVANLFHNQPRTAKRLDFKWQNSFFILASDLAFSNKSSCASLLSLYTRELTIFCFGSGHTCILEYDTWTFCFPFLYDLPISKGKIENSFLLIKWKYVECLFKCT